LGFNVVLVYNWLESERYWYRDVSMERKARALLGAGSGGVLGLMVAGMFRLGAWGLAVCVVGIGVIVAVLQSRAETEPKPAAPRIALGAALSGMALLLGLAVLVGQAVYVQTTGNTQIPLPIWPVTSKLLWSAMALALAGIGAALSGLAQQRSNREAYGGGRLVLTAVVGGCATLALALMSYLTGRGFPLGG
jgi:hypothetical protein